MNSIYLQIFLLINVFLIGIASVLVFQHALAHFKPHKHDAEKDRRPQAEVLHIPPAIRDRLIQNSQVHFQNVLAKSASELERDLKIISLKLSKKLEKLGTDIIDDETKMYHASLAKLSQQAASELAGAQSQITKHQAELNAKLEEQQKALQAKLSDQQTALEAKMVEDINTKKEQLEKQINTKLSDAVASFLVETMQHNVDLGSQSKYITSMLEDHKDEIIKGVKDEI